MRSTIVQRKVSKSFILYGVHLCHIFLISKLFYHHNQLSHFIFVPKPAKQVISLDVEYAPEVEATEIFVHAATGNIHTERYICLNRKVWPCLMMNKK